MSLGPRGCRQCFGVVQRLVSIPSGASATHLCEPADAARLFSSRSVILLATTATFRSSARSSSRFRSGRRRPSWRPALGGGRGTRWPVRRATRVAPHALPGASHAPVAYGPDGLRSGRVRNGMPHLVWRSIYFGCEYGGLASPRGWMAPDGNARKTSTRRADLAVKPHEGHPTLPRR